MSNFWLYHDRSVGRARVHKRHCVYCNDGRGQINKPRVPGGPQVWFPFETLDAALSALAALPSRDLQCCKSCLPSVGGKVQEVATHVSIGNTKATA